MKQTLRHIFLLVALFMATVSAWAECVILNDGGTYTIMEYKFPAYQATPKVFDISNPRPSGMLTFNYSEGTAPTGGATVTATFLDNTTQEIISKNDSKNQSYNFNGKIVKSLKFVGTGTVKKSISNIKLTQATYTDAPEETTWETLPKIIGSEKETLTTTMKWSDTEAFSCSLSGAGASQFEAGISNNATTCSYGTATISVSYKHDKIGQHEAILTISNGTYSHDITLKGETVDKYTADFNWTIANTGENTGAYLIGKNVAVSGAYNLSYADNDLKGELSVNFAVETISIVADSNGSDVIAIENGVITAKNAGKAKITATCAGDALYKPFTKELILTIDKHDPVFTWKTNVPYNSEITDFFTTTSSNSFTFDSSDKDVATLSLNANQSLTLHTYHKRASTDITVAQDSNYYWHAKTETKTITPVHASDHIVNADPINANNYGAFIKELPREKFSWSTSEGAFLLGNEDLTVGDSEDKSVIISFSGVPKDLQFSYAKTRALATDTEWSVYESANDTDWGTAIWKSEEGSGTSGKIELNPGTKYLKFVYSGNYGGYFKNITISERKYLQPSQTSISFGDVQIDKTKFPEKTFVLHYANAGYKVNLTSTNPDKFTVTPGNITTIGGEYCSTYEVPIKVTFITQSATTEGRDNGKILITDECGNSAEIDLDGFIYKIPQSLYWVGDWQAERPAISINTTASDVARATSTLPVTFESSNPSVIEVVNGNQLKANALGTSTITISQEGNEDWEAAPTLSKEFVVTNKIIQYIDWQQDFEHLLTTDAAIELNAVIQLEDANGNRIESSERTALLKYYSEDPNVVSVENNKLTIKGEGTTRLIAYEQGDATYEQVYLALPVYVRVPITGCTPNNLAGDQGELEFFQMNLYEIKKEPIELNLSEGVPGTLSFKHRGKKWGLNYSGPIKAQEYLVDDNGDGQWKDIAGSSVTPTVSDEYATTTVQLSENATHVRFIRPKNGTGYHYVKDITVTPLQFIRADLPTIDFGEIVVGSDESAEFVVSYSNMQGEIYIETSDPSQLSVEKKVIVDDCGAMGSMSNVLYFKPTQTSDNFNEKITIIDKRNSVSCTIIVKAIIKKGNQSITWTPSTQQMTSSQDWLQNTIQNAISSVDLPVIYTIPENEFAHFDDEGNLVIDKCGGTFKIIASQAGNDNFNAANSVEIPFTIPADLQLTFIGGKDENQWKINPNWNFCRPPKENEKIVVEAPAKLTEHATVDGITLSVGDNTTGSLHITHEGGLTIGKEGVARSSNLDNIIIDNNHSGAGFLRVHPEASNKPDKVTMKYTTRAQSGDPYTQVWQYVGAPGDDMTMSDEGVMIYHWSEEKGWLSANAQMQPFVGYALTRTAEGEGTYTITAKPIFDDHTINLTKTDGGMNGDNLFVNSYLAPIDLTKLQDIDDQNNDPNDDLIGNFDKTFYLFNSGSWNAWQNQGGSNNNGFIAGDYPGQYYAIPLLGTKLLDNVYEQTTLAPMQGVYVIANESGAQIKLRYNKHVYTATPDKPNSPMRAPQIKDEDFMRVRIQVNSEHSGADRMYVVQYNQCTKGFDNGYDARNIVADGQVNIYTVEQDGQMEISVADQIDSTYIGFTAGRDSEYKLTFTSLEGEQMYLKDLDQNEIIPIIDEGQYVFYAQPNSVNNKRFQILLHPDLSGDNNGNVSTEAENIFEAAANVWMHNKKLYITNAPENSVLSVYSVSSLCVVSARTISHTPYTLDLSHLPIGVYVIRLNDQAYKFVCE